MEIEVTGYTVGLAFSARTIPTYGVRCTLTLARHDQKGWRRGACGSR